jgi:hypothetical protein
LAALSASRAPDRRLGAIIQAARAMFVQNGFARISAETAGRGAG